MTPSPVPNPIDLCTVGQLQQYLTQGLGTGGGGAAVTGNPALQQRLVTAASKTAMTYMGRNPFVTPYSELYDGTGTPLLVLKQWPIVSISSVQIFGGCGWFWGYPQPVFPAQPLVIQPSASGSPGFVIEADAGTITLTGGYSFAYGVKNVNVVYLAGFTQAFPETQTITNGTVTLDNAATWVANVGVVYAQGASAGTALTLVLINPDIGQYTVSQAGVYGFNSGDEALLVTVTYQYGQPPYDLQDAVCEIAAAEYRRLQHIDQDSQGVAEATTSFSKLAIPRLAMLRIEQYKSKIPAM